MSPSRRSIRISPTAGSASSHGGLSSRFNIFIISEVDEDGTTYVRFVTTDETKADRAQAALERAGVTGRVESLAVDAEDIESFEAEITALGA
jgi:hypothetical protein